MSVNRYKPHVLMLPEDDANRQLANGFLMHPALAIRNVQVLEEVGGSNQVLVRFRKDHIVEMERYANRFMILLLDFDDRGDRLTDAGAWVPEHLMERVFILGAQSEPEALKKALSCAYESIGLGMARDCAEGTGATWGHAHLAHNSSELSRMRNSVQPILFPGI